MYHIMMYYAGFGFAAPASRPPGIVAQRLRTLGEAGVRNQTWAAIVIITIISI